MTQGPGGRLSRPRTSSGMRDSRKKSRAHLPVMRQAGAPGTAAAETIATGASKAMRSHARSEKSIPRAVRQPRRICGTMPASTRRTNCSHTACGLTDSGPRS